MNVQRVAYVVLRCADLERSRRFYEGLGLRFSPEQHGNGPKHYSCELGGMVLELYPLSDKTTSGLRLGLVVSDLDRILESLSALGAAVGAIGSEGNSPVTVLDPDGHQIALEQERMSHQENPLQMSGDIVDPPRSRK
ncbi:VOC family protein [Sorangium sp. So ce1000]|uniref:VOC family protein n=1 Tax=Sorangium sp. So ce1000 TaxID=3133325 RepID=UPI003F609991